MCLLAWPASTIGHRNFVWVDLSTDPHLCAYWARVRELLTLEPAFAPGTVAELAPSCLTLAPGAYKRRPGSTSAPGW
jgi:hypothetical protein